MSLSNRNPYLFEHKQNHFFHLTQELSPKLCQSHSAGGICLSLWAAPIENRIVQAVCGAGHVDRFRPQHSGVYTYADNEAYKHGCLQKSTEIKFCVQGRCKQRRDLGSKLVHHAGRGENSILVLLCLDEAQNVLKTS